MSYRINFFQVKLVKTQCGHWLISIHDVVGFMTVLIVDDIVLHNSLQINTFRTFPLQTVTGFVILGSNTNPR